MEFFSTTILAEKLEMETSELFYNLKALGWIERINDKWSLTDKGKTIGGQIRTNPKFADYIVWPESILTNRNALTRQAKLINATAIGKHFNVSSQRLNLILSELGWIERDVAGWFVTKLGKAVGGRQFEHETSGAAFVMWPEDILRNPNLNTAFSTFAPEEKVKSGAPPIGQSPVESKSTDIREKFEAKYRTKDGHYVRSRAEVIIDNTLYEYGLAHAYEKQLPVEESLLTDFYLPAKKVYIEYWGMENDPAYMERKKKKIEIYKKYELNLIELNDADISNLDDFLPKKLLKFDIKVY